LALRRLMPMAGTLELLVVGERPETVELDELRQRRHVGPVAADRRCDHLPRLLEERRQPWNRRQWRGANRAVLGRIGLAR
jgi:hypothetical protein